MLPHSNIDMTGFEKVYTRDYKHGITYAYPRDYYSSKTNYYPYTETELTYPTVRQGVYIISSAGTIFNKLTNSYCNQYPKK